MPVLRSLAAFTVLLAGLAAGPPPAHACACCTNVGQRYDAVEPFDSGKVEEVARLRFDPAAELFVGEADLDVIKGIAGASSAHFDLRVSHSKERLIFTFRDKSGRTGTLMLTLPRSMAVLAVDPRRVEPQGGLGPALYREWKLTAAAEGTGMFAPGVGKGQRLTLVLQGYGNNCSGLTDATHWTLEVAGPRARYHLFGNLQP